MKDSAKAERRDRAEKGKRVLFERESLALNQHEQEDDDDDDDSGAKRCLRYFEYVVYCVGQVCATVVLIFVSCVCFSKMSHLTAVHAWLSTFGVSIDVRLFSTYTSDIYLVFSLCSLTPAQRLSSDKFHLFVSSHSLLSFSRCSLCLY